MTDDEPVKKEIWRENVFRLIIVSFYPPLINWKQIKFI